MTTQREYIRSEINVLEYAVRVVADDILRQNGLYHGDEDMTALKSLIDCIMLSARIITTEEIQMVLNVYVSGLAYVATQKTLNTTPIAHKLKEERKLLEALLRFRREIWQRLTAGVYLGPTLVTTYE